MERSTQPTLDEPFSRGREKVSGPSCNLGPVLPVLLLLLSADPALGTPLKQGGFTFRPPKQFRVTRMDLFHGTRVGAISNDASGYLAAALVDGDGEDATSMLVAVVDAPFSPGPSSRDEVATEAVRHFNEDLGLKLALERAELVNGPPARVEVLGSIRQGSQLRVIHLAAFEGEPKHLVITVSAPSGRAEELAGQLKESFDSVRAEGGTATAPRAVAWAAMALVAALFFVSVGLWRRRLANR